MSEKNYSGRLTDGRCVRVAVRGTQIASVTPLADDPALPYLLPPLVDLQQNGACGTYFNELERQGIGRLEVIARHLRRHGVGRCQLTLTTYDPEGQERTAALLDRKLSADADLATLFFGIFHEGYYISPQDGWRGAHAREWVVPPDYERFRRLDALTGHRIRVVNVAPEEPGGLDFIQRAVRDGKVAAIGHCAPSAEIVREAALRGATLVTHFGNGAAPMVHRFKNPFWAFMDEPKLKLGLICDGFHLPGEVVRVALKIKGRENCFPVSDASGYAGMPAGEYGIFGHRSFVIEPNGFLHIAGSELLSGAWFQQDRCVEFLVRQGKLPFLDAWEMCSLQPARLAGITLPSLAAGAEASFVLARWDDGVVIEQSVHLGAEYCDKPVRPTEPALTTA